MASLATNFCYFSPAIPRQLSLQMIHSTELDMTEKGTEGDAITIVGYNFMSAKLKPVFVKFEDQFLYIVLDQGDLWIYLMGKVINPSEK